MDRVAAMLILLGLLVVSIVRGDSPGTILLLIAHSVLLL